MVQSKTSGGEAGGEVRSGVALSAVVVLAVSAAAIFIRLAPRWRSPSGGTLWVCSKEDDTSVDSSTGFTLPDGAVRYPEASPNFRP